MLFTSCSVKPTEIDVSDLETVCDYVDAQEKCLVAYDEVMGNSKRTSELPEDQAIYARELRKKFKEIEAAAQDEFSRSECKTCPNYERMRHIALRLF